MKLRTRISVVAAGAVAIAVVLVSAAAFLVARQQLRSEVDDSLIERAVAFQGLGNDPRGIMGSEGPFRRGFGLFGFSSQGSAFDTVYYQVTLSTGEVLIPEGQGILPPANTGVGDNAVVLSDARIDDVHVRMATVQSDLLGTVQIARPLTEVDATLAGLAAALFAFGTVGVLLAAGVFGESKPGVEGPAMRVLVRDSQGRPEVATAAVRELEAAARRTRARLDAEPLGAGCSTVEQTLRLAARRSASGGRPTCHRR